MTYWIEVRTGLRRSGKPKLVPLSDADNYRGFRSTFAFDDEVADIIRIQGGTAGLRGFPVYCDTIFMDFDGHDPAEFRDWIRSSGIGHSEFSSGNRSIHYHIPIVPVFGAWVPDAVKRWTLQHAPSADISYLHQAGMYRLPGTFHHKNPGACKSLLFEMSGDPVVLTEPQARELAPITRDIEVSEEYLFTELMSKKQAGGRSLHIWKLATIAGKLGKSEAETMSILEWWNEMNCSPMHSEDVLSRQLASAYKQLRRKV